LFDWDEDSEIRQLALRYLKNFDEHFNKGEAPMLIGRSGTGKSRMAAALLNTITENSNVTLETAWLPASEYFNSIIDAKDLRQGDRYSQLVGTGKTADLLVVDDISTLRNYPRLLEWLWIILEHRYSEMMPTIVTANFSITTSSSLWEEIAEHTTIAISRRLYEGSKDLTLIL